MVWCGVVWCIVKCQDYPETWIISLLKLTVLTTVSYLLPPPLNHKIYSCLLLIITDNSFRKVYFYLILFCQSQIPLVDLFIEPKCQFAKRGKRKEMFLNNKTPLWFWNK